MTLVANILVFDTAIKLFSTDFPGFDTGVFFEDAIF